MGNTRISASVLGVLLLALGGAGCGGTSSRDDHGGAAGEGATGGTGGTGATGGTGGTGGTVSTPAALGVSLTLSSPSAAKVPNLGSRICTAGESGGFTYALGAPAPGHTIEDGKDGVQVQCTVTASGGFSLTGSGTDTNGGKPVSFTFNGTVNDKSNPANNPGSMSFFSPDTLTLSTLDGFPGCTIGPVTTLKTGAILTDIDCPLIGGIDDTTSGCQVHGTIAFEYCDPGAVGGGSPTPGGS